MNTKKMDIREMYEFVVDQQDRTDWVKPTRQVVLADRKFNEWLDKMDIPGELFAKRNRAFCKFCETYCEGFTEKLRSCKAITQEASKQADKLSAKWSGGEYRYTPDELLGDDWKAFREDLAIIIATNAPFCISMSSHKEMNGITIERKTPYGEIRVTGSNEIDDRPDIWIDAIWEQYKRDATQEEIAMCERACDVCMMDIPCRADERHTMGDETPEAIIKHAATCVEQAINETDKQYIRAQTIAAQIVKMN